MWHSFIYYCMHVWLYIHEMFKFVDKETKRRIQVFFWVMKHMLNIVYTDIVDSRDKVYIFTITFKYLSLLLFQIRYSSISFTTLYICSTTLYHSHKKTLKTFVYIGSVASMHFIGNVDHTWVCNISFLYFLLGVNNI